MGYYMRFIGIGQAVTIKELKTTLIAIDKKYKVIEAQIEATRGELLYQNMLLGEIEINQPDDGIFDDDIEELIDLISDSGQKNEAKIINSLKNATFIVAVSALWEGKDSDQTLAKLDALWDLLFENKHGILQADNDGFYDQTGLILESNLKI